MTILCYRISIRVHSGRGQLQMEMASNERAYTIQEMSLRQRGKETVMATKKAVTPRSSPACSSKRPGGASRGGRAWASDSEGSAAASRDGELELLLQAAAAAAEYEGGGGTATTGGS
ncbi:hypothetical protein LOK49_LG14G00350 [Camellia lanceoleosa]|uniref:Uncharacterized protein n=1 Tax=Camellia lanceoleosa TaxID=1840588 RepID=A0ACC0FD50_9ERIC|nr:hypothetical protein LOK49_LG14G00350 [Camellia lanceoleosa]